MNLYKARIVVAATESSPSHILERYVVAPSIAEGLTYVSIVAGEVLRIKLAAENVLLVPPGPAPKKI